MKDGADMADGGVVDDIDMADGIHTVYGIDAGHDGIISDIVGIGTIVGFGATGIWSHCRTW